MRDEAERVIHNVGRRIAELRRSKDLTQAELSELVGVNTKQIGVYESGRANLTLRTLAIVAGVLGVSTAELLEQPRSRAPRRAGRPRGR